MAEIILINVTHCFFKNKAKTNLVVHICNPGTWEAVCAWTI